MSEKNTGSAKQGVNPNRRKHRKPYHNKNKIKEQVTKEDLELENFDEESEAPEKAEKTEKSEKPNKTETVNKSKGEKDNKPQKTSTADVEKAPVKVTLPEHKGIHPPFTDFSVDVNEEYLEHTKKMKEEAEKEEKTNVIGIRFRTSSKVYYFDPCGVEYVEDSFAVVETARGVEFGYVAMGNKDVPTKDLVLPLRPALRPASKEDKAHYSENREKEGEAFEICSKKIEEHQLDMKLIDTEYTFDNSKLLFYFTAESRVDFRELVKDLASVFRCRIELRQMGIRDEAKVLGGLGVCGRPFCCSVFLPDFAQVSIKMAKEQGLSLNSSKISGACGRLMCCLRFEHETYFEELQKTPAVEAVVMTPAGKGTVVESKPLLAMVKVRMFDNPDAAPQIFSRDDVKVLSEKQPDNQ